MTSCLDCGSPGISTLACKLYGSCKMHDDANHNRRLDELHESGKKHLTEKTYEEARSGLWTTKGKR